MKRLTTLMLAGAVVLIGGPADAAGDKVYRYRSHQDLPALRAYDNQPYWRALAECAGIHGVLVSRFEAAGQAGRALAARDRGVGFLRMANDRLKADRGLTDAQALAITAPVVDAGRGSAEAIFRTPTASQTAYSHEQIIDGMCAQLSERHAKAAR